MIKIKNIVFAGLLILIANPWVSGACAESLVLIYSGNLDGELEPCGCAEEGNFGGINRRVSTLDKLRAEYPDLVAISGGGLIAAQGVTDHIKAEFILKGFEALKYDAIGMQWKDLSYGAKFAVEHNLPWVASNWNQGKAVKEIVISRTIGGKSVSMKVFSWLDPEFSPLRKMHGEHTVVQDNAAQISEAITKADSEGYVTVLITSLPLEMVKDSFDLNKVDILFVRASYEVFGEPKQQGKTLVLQPGSRGMRIAKLDLQVNDGGDITKWGRQVIPMPATVPDAPRMAEWYQAYNAKVKADYLNRVEIRKQLDSGASDYVGEEKCKTCHESQHKTWFASQHAIAFEDLEGVNKAFDPACIGCHTVGFNKPGGFVDLSITPHLLNVQCESCHGPSKAHAESSGAKPVSNHDWPKQKICGQCHVQKHSPSFSVEKYWPKIAH